MSIVYEAIKALSFTPKEKTDLRAFFVNNPDKRKEVELFIFECTDDEVVSCLRNVLKPEPVTAPLQVTENQDLNGFIKALKDTDFNTKTSDLLELADNTKFFGLKNQPSKLFIRNCYKDLFQTVLKPEIRNLRISNSLGIGKPFFGYYLLYDLLKKDRTIVYELHTMKSSVILFKEGKGFYLNEIFNHKIIRNYLHKENTWYIIDIMLLLLRQFLFLHQ
ncbi:crinkler (CRN) family protein, putative [Rhizophagus irregularis DAOM 181602=DAOM 197198]|nr:crinkler (CRN) family protein, putative [Rhizophagus irregularis DAOM 181602=DAOM 197198]